jgi:hypothetical protein
MTFYKKFERRFNDRLLPSQIRITVAQLSLINDDPEEKIYPIYLISVFDGYDYTSGLHDIAMLQVCANFDFEMSKCLT